MAEYNSFEDVPQKDRHYFKPSMFPPTETEVEQMHLERAFRILPHHQDTGGFFVALLRMIECSSPVEQIIGQEAINSVIDK